jgi:hypothetical protein
MSKLNLFIVMLLALFIALPASAQVSLGLIGGLNLANINTDPQPEGNVDLKSRPVLGSGGVLELRLTENVGLYLQPMFLQKGAKAKGSVDEELDSVNVELKMNYIEIPVFLKFAFGANTIKPYLMAGPTLGLRLSARETGTLSIGGVQQEIDEDVKVNTRTFDFGLGFGAGVSFPLGNNFVFLEGRYALGLSNISDDPEDPDAKIKTRGIQIMTGIAFPLGGK